MIYSLGLRECSLFKLLCVKSLFLSFCALQEETTCIDVQVKPICAFPSSGKSVLRNSTPPRRTWPLLTALSLCQPRSFPWSMF